MITSALRRCLSTLTLVAALATPAWSQGRTDYLNVESPPVHPIEIAVVDGTAYVLVANTPDNSVEIWRPDDGNPENHRFVKRVRVGLEPVSVRFNADLSRMYTANFLGDSISVVRLKASGGRLDVIVERTDYVGDEPMDIAFGAFPSHADGGTTPAQPRSGRQAPTSNAGSGSGSATQSGPGLTSGASSGASDVKPHGDASPVLYVTYNTYHTVGIRDALDLRPVGDVVRLIDDTGPTRFGLKEPRAVALHDGQLFVLGFKGGNSEAYDFDVFVGSRHGDFQHALSGLGSTNANMAFANDGSLFVVGGEAQNHLLTLDDLAAAPTGFVKSVLYWIQDPGTGQPIVQRRDLNALVDSADVLSPVPPQDALALPTDVTVFESAGQPTKVFVAAYGSDRVGVLEPVAGVEPTEWATRRIEIAPLANVVAGPRGLALKPALPGHAIDPDARLYVMNRLDNSVTVIDPVTETVMGSFELARQATPDHIRLGRPFLYSAKLTSGSGFVACASCHTDGRTDVLTWFVGNLDLSSRDPFPAHLASGIPGDVDVDGDCAEELAFYYDYIENGYPPNGDEIMTQSLQGLLNFEAEPTTALFFRNAPYHWRGDRAKLSDFNSAYVSLMGMPDVSGDPDTPPKGLTNAEMDQFVDFLRSIHYPPNPQQPITRTLSGDFGDVASADDWTVGSGAQLGMKLFHTKALSNSFGQSCVHCHPMPDGSDNRLTVTVNVGGLLQPMESSALRGLFQKEFKPDLGNVGISDVVIGEYGTGHQPIYFSLNDFNALFIGELGGEQESGAFPDQLVAVNAFTRELDWGVAPIVGRSRSVHATDAGLPATQQALDLFESQAALANAGVAVQAWIAGKERGFWYDLSADVPEYREVGSVLKSSRAELLGLLSSEQDLLVFQAVPLGSERRVAHAGVFELLTGPPPTGVELLPMPTNTAYANIPLLRRNWPVAAVEPDIGFQWLNACAKTPAGSKAVRLMQYGLIQDAAAEQGFGLPDLRHEAPRRFRVAGHDIRHGASLQLSMGIYGPPDPDGPLDEGYTYTLTLPLYPTGAAAPDGRRIWETAAEVDPLVAYTLLLGGPYAPGILEATFDVDDTIPEPPPAGFFDPLAWNWYHVAIRNLDDTSGNGGWQRLRLE